MAALTTLALYLLSPTTTSTHAFAFHLKSQARGHGLICSTSSSRRQACDAHQPLPRRRKTHLASQTNSIFENLLGRQPRSTVATSSAGATVQNFVEQWNAGNLDDALSCVSQDCEFDFATYARSCVGIQALERRLRLLQEAFPERLVVVDKLVSNERAAGLKFHMETISGEPVAQGRGSAFFNLNDQGLIQNVYWVTETDNKAGENGLKVLREASKIMKATGINPAKTTAAAASPTNVSTTTTTTPNAQSSCAPVEYFAAWSRRDMDAAVDLFADDIAYEDTAFPKPFVGKEALQAHLVLCADSFPATFTFNVDDCIDVGDTVCLKWHVENNGEPLPYTRGCSFYEINKDGKIQDGMDFIEPAVFKPGGPELLWASLRNKITQEPARLVPLAVWVAYMWIVFFSDGILPGANALALEQRTWEEVRDLSINFFLVSPILGLPFSPVVHPMLEGVFNWLLSWAAMFAAFLSDDRQDKPNLFPMLPAVVGMQFLTSAFLLLYLVTRSTEKRSDVSVTELNRVARACESPLLGILMGGVGTLSMAWAFLGRQEAFGGLAERWHSFVDLLSIDRVGSSFLVDLVIFGLFQFWLIDDDMKRRGAAGTDTGLVALAKFVPFFGMAAYIVQRPRLPSQKNAAPDEERR